jgi:hypothetical protein
MNELNPEDPEDDDEFEEFWSKPAPYISPRRRWFSLRRRPAATPVVTWQQVEAWIIDACDDVFPDWDIPPVQSGLLADLISDSLLGAGIEVVNDQPSGPTVAEMFRNAGLSTSMWPGKDEGVKPW